MPPTVDLSEVVYGQFQIELARIASHCLPQVLILGVHPAWWVIADKNLYLDRMAE